LRGAVQKHQQRQRRVRRGFWYEQDCIPLSLQSELDGFTTSYVAEGFAVRRLTGGRGMRAGLLSFIVKEIRSINTASRIQRERGNCAACECAETAPVDVRATVFHSSTKITTNSSDL